MVKHKSLAEERPDLLKEWDYEENDKLGIYPDKVAVFSNKKVWWKCNKCNYKWNVSISHRAGGTNCPVCAGRKILVGFNDLKTLRPDLFIEWDYEENNKLGIYPDKITCGSGKKVWWICSKCGNKWQAVIAMRCAQNTNCPVCSNRKVVEGYNDLATVNPDLVKEWNYEKNGDLLPSQVSYGSNKKVWWKCNKGHVWKVAVNHRALRKSGCPKCAVTQTSFAEQAIYYFLKMYFSGEVENRYKLKDEKGFIEADIFLPKLNVVIEHDGAYWHEDKQEKDLEKEYRLRAIGIKFIRIAEHNVNKVVGNCILYSCRKNRDENLTWAIRKLFSMLNINGLFVNVLAFKDKILEFTHINDVKNSLVFTNPELVKEWNYEKNGNLKPTMFTYGSVDRVWWICSKGHEWQARIDSRVRGNGCPKCAKKKRALSHSLPKKGKSLQDKFPVLVKEWDYEKNGNLLPSQVNCGSHRKVWWKCSEGHNWQATIANRCNGNNCPKCALTIRGRKRSLPKKGQSLQDKFPELAKEWNYERNYDLLPTQVTYCSGKKVWWKCYICKHEWQAVISSRSNGSGCPECAKVRRRKK